MFFFVVVAVVLHYFSLVCGPIIQECLCDSLHVLYTHSKATRCQETCICQDLNATPKSAMSATRHDDWFGILWLEILTSLKVETFSVLGLSHQEIASVITSFILSCRHYSSRLCPCFFYFGSRM